METLTKIRLAKEEKFTIDIISSHTVCDVAQIILKSYSKVLSNRLLSRFYVLSINGIILRSFRTEAVAMSVFIAIRKLLEKIEKETIRSCVVDYIG